MYKNSKKEAIKLPLIIQKNKQNKQKADWVSQQLTIYEVKEPSLEIGRLGFWIQSSKK